MQTQGYVSRFEPLLYVPTYTQKDFHYIHRGPSTNGPPQRNYNSTSGVYNSSLYTITFTQEGRHKVKAKKKGLQLSDLMITNSLGDLKGSPTIFLTKIRS